MILCVYTHTQTHTHTHTHSFMNVLACIRSKVSFCKQLICMRKRSFPSRSLPIAPKIYFPIHQHITNSVCIDSYMHIHTVTYIHEQSRIHTNTERVSILHEQTDVYTHIRTHTHTETQTSIHTHTRARTHTRTLSGTHTYTYPHVHAHR